MPKTEMESFFDKYRMRNVKETEVSAQPLCGNRILKVFDAIQIM